MLSEDQVAIQETVRALLVNELPLERVRAGFEERGRLEMGGIWRRAGDLGFFGLGVDEKYGGSGFSLAEEMVLFNELGRSLAPGPWLGSVLAVHVLPDGLLRTAVLRGEVPCALALGADGSEISISGGRVSGTLSSVANAAFAGALLLDCGAAWYYVPRAGVRWGVEPRRSLDPTRPLYSVSLSEIECIKVATGADAARLRRAATVLACAEAVGGVERTVEMSVQYCKVRTQFDRPIGSFQAVKHRCADMAVRAEVARSAAIYATICARDDTDDADHHVSVAKWLCAEAYLQNAADNIQNHGGMGFTWECDAHLYLKRAHGFDSSFGSRSAHLDRLVAELRA